MINIGTSIKGKQIDLLHDSLKKQYNLESSLLTLSLKFKGLFVENIPLLQWNQQNFELWPALSFSVVSALIFASLLGLNKQLIQQGMPFDLWPKIDSKWH